MNKERARSGLDRLLDTVAGCLTPDAAHRLLEVRADPEFQERIDTLAGRCAEGRLTAEEREEYESYVRAIQIVSILQVKVSKLLEGNLRRNDGHPPGIARFRAWW